VTGRVAAAIAALALVLAGCPASRAALRPPPRADAAAPAPRAEAPLPPPSSRTPPVPLVAEHQHDEPALEGIVHVVKRGETVYRIARAYAIDPADLMETNGISDPRSVAVGAELFVPGATREVEVPSAPVPGDPAHPGQPASRTSSSSSSSSSSPPSSTTTSTSTSPPTDTGPSSHTPAPSPAPAPSPHTAAVPTAPAALTRNGKEAVLGWPLKGVLYGRYGVRAGQRHDGIDIAAPEGTVVNAAAAGTVIYAGEQSGYGAIVILRHENGLVTLYAHNSRLLVDEGARVHRGDAIARVGQTGRTTGPHLHFEVREGTRPRNPLLYLP
jgi:murein DD-endopeptidase MepM/ murein hydrolase activator NlpD